MGRGNFDFAGMNWNQGKEVKTLRREKEGGGKGVFPKVGASPSFAGDFFHAHTKRSVEVGREEESRTGSWTHRGGSVVCQEWGKGAS